jgi:hypothetical protein
MLGHDKPSTTLDVYSDLFDADLDESQTVLTASALQRVGTFWGLRPPR